MNTTVIIPVYNAKKELQICIESLLRTLTATVPVLLIDDCSSDRTVPELLQHYQSYRPKTWKVLNNEKNLGFVGTVNRGIRETATDVVLLNSDTEATLGWLDRMEACAASDEKIATVTPFSNNGEIVSFPNICTAEAWPEDPDKIARACARVATPSYPDLPTAVGFCMWLRRRALDQLGLFDEAAFGKGYGEENDFSQRAQKNGWRNVLCDDAYVAHRGGASFLPLGLERSNRKALQTVLARHPDYLNQVMRFIQEDPLASRRQEIIRELKNSELENNNI